MNGLKSITLKNFSVTQNRNQLCALLKSNSERLKVRLLAKVFQGTRKNKKAWPRRIPVKIHKI